MLGNGLLDGIDFPHHLFDPRLILLVSTVVLVDVGLGRRVLIRRVGLGLLL